jgi:AraC-like DNA-binding protein
MMQTLNIKNMVCNRCKTVVSQIFNNEGFQVLFIELGKVVFEENINNNFIKLEGALKKEGFELIKETSVELIEKIKIALIKHIDINDTDYILSELANELGKTYSFLSKSFSKSEGITLEKYFINLKIEKVKEYIQLNQLNFSEIAYSLNYKNSSHLAKQFKNSTGITMTDYKKLQTWNRKPLDQIV